MAEIRLSLGKSGPLLGRLLVTVLDALRAQVARRLVSSSDGISEEVASALELGGFGDHGRYWVLEL